jgi:FdrA protein
MSVLRNHVVRGRYLDSVSLMRMSRTLCALPGVAEAAVMIGSDNNKSLMRDSGLLTGAAQDAQANDLLVGIRADDDAAAAAALDELRSLLARKAEPAGGSGMARHRGLRSALQSLPGANLALISVPGEFAAAEAARALRHDLHVLLFSNNVPLAQERMLKELARSRGLLMMGPDCGTSLINGVPLAFANVVPRGEVGVVAASGTGLQEVTTLIARAGGGISHGIGVGGRDLRDEIGAITTLAALDALDADAATSHIVLVSKPPAPRVAGMVLGRISRSRKSFTVCLLGGGDVELPANARRARTLREAAELAVGAGPLAPGFVAGTRLRPGSRGHAVRGLYCGGTLCAEAQLIFLCAGLEVRSNAPVPGAGRLPGHAAGGHVLLDLGAEEYTQGRPHPMIDPAIRNDALLPALADPDTAAVLIDVVIGYGSHPDPAAIVAAALAAAPPTRPAVIASVCGTEGDPQVYSRQVRMLEEAGVVVAPSNAHAAELALTAVRRS